MRHALWVSDALCRLASDGSFAVRQLYTDRGDPGCGRWRPGNGSHPRHRGRTDYVEWQCFRTVAGRCPHPRDDTIFDRGRLAKDLPKRLQAGSGPRAQRYPLRPFSIVSAYPPTEKLSIDGLRARSRPSLVLGEFSSAASELTVMTMLTMSQAQIVQIIGCSRFGATPIIWTLESTLEARDGDPWGWLVSEAE